MKKQFRSDLTKYLLWIFAAFVVANLFPNILILVFIIFLSYKYIKSKDELVYFAVYISLIADLAGLFGDNFNGLISISLIEFNLVQIFIFVNIIKYIVNFGQKNPILYFQKPIIVFLAYFVFLILSGFIFGVEDAGKSGLRHYYQIANVIVLMPIFLVLPYLLKADNFINRLSYILFFSVFLNIAGQVFMLIWGVPISQFINPPQNYSNIAGETNYIQDALRPVIASWLVILALFLSFFAIVKKSHLFKLNFLYLVLFASFFSIFITATRGWILAFMFFIILGTLLFSPKIGKRLAGALTYGAIVFFTLYGASNLFKTQVDKSFERFSTIELIAEGDISAGGTNIRHIRGAKVMEGFYKSPIIGLGFSSEGLKDADQHVGNQMILQSGGIIGFIVIMYLLSKIYFKSLHLNKLLLKHRRNYISYRGELKLIPVFLGSLFIIHSTSTSLFGYSIYVIAYGNMLWVAIYISIINKILNEYINK
ncbi:MAG: hypothetical protein U9P82_10800 [Bacteroidota bacterium]|nr:hypothetical protein [Bacteroidota bacterium]